jgi:UDP-2,4-diacetamido-2,4,6-trideoxy-beta-L-altropyranose hydrolase
MNEVLIRCDGGRSDGLGHIMRCLTLARAFRTAGQEPLFVTAVGPEYVGCKKIESFGFTAIAAGGAAGNDDDLASLLPRLCSKGKPILIADNRNIGPRYLVACREAACTVYIDDEAGWTPPVDILGNGKIDVSAETYCRDEQGPVLLIGPEYNLVRDEFFSIIHSQSGGKPRLLITLGGEDPFNHTAWIVRHTSCILQTVEVTIVIGPAHPDPAGVFAAVKEFCPHASVLSDVRDMVEVFVKTDLAITTGGTTCYELAVAGIPALAIVIEGHQWNLVRSMAAAGCLEILGHGQDIDAARVNEHLKRLVGSREDRAALAAAGRKLFPAPGAKRIVQRIMEFYQTNQHSNEH